MFLFVPDFERCNFYSALFTFAPLFLSHPISNQTFQLLPQKAIFWVEEEILIVSDLHLGKSHHFRKGGIAVPIHGDYDNLQILANLILTWKPKQIIFLGDLFHSLANNHMIFVVDFMKQFKKIKMDLVVGNHDIIDVSWYNALNLKVHPTILIIHSFVFSHEPMDHSNFSTEMINICGHIHPCITLKAKAKQSLTLPCFYFKRNQVILPAFGKFTGNFKIIPQNNDRVFVVTADVVMSIS